MFNFLLELDCKVMWAKWDHKVLQGCCIIIITINMLLNLVLPFSFGLQRTTGKVGHGVMNHYYYYDH